MTQLVQVSGGAEVEVMWCLGEQKSAFHQGQILLHKKTYYCKPPFGISQAVKMKARGPVEPKKEP